MRVFVVLFSLLSLYLHGAALVSSSAQTVVSFETDFTAFEPLADAILGYSLLNHDVHMNMLPATGAGQCKKDIFNNALDFVVTSSAMTALELQTHPNLSMFPFAAAALVPVYRVDGLDLGSPPIIISRSALNLIFTGNITYWDDPRIASVNPTLSIPHLAITLITLADVGIINYSWTTVLSMFAGSSKALPVSTDPAWPAGAIKVVGVTGVPSKVLTINGAIGYAPLGVAARIDVSIARMVNKAGQVVTASTNSINFAVMELATPSIGSGSVGKIAFTLFDASGGSAWPIVIPSYLYIDSLYSRGTCAVRKAVVDFWLWFLSSPVVFAVLQANQFSEIPSVVMSQLHLIDSLSTNILCDNNVVLQSSSTSNTVQIYGGPEFGTAGNLFTLFYNGLDLTTEYTYTLKPSQLMFDKISNGEADIAFLDLKQVSTASLADNAANLLILPQLLVHLIIAYNPQLSDGVNVGSSQLVINYDLLAKIFTGAILQWNDPQIVALNPVLSAYNTSMPITIIVACTLENSLSTFGPHFASFLYDNSPYFRSIVSQYPALLEDWCAGLTQLASSISPGLRWIGAGSDLQLSSIELVTNGGLTYEQQSSNSNIGVFKFQHWVDGAPIVFEANSDTAYRCADQAWDNGALDFDSHAARLVCWPLTVIISSVCQSSFDLHEVANGNKSLALLKYFVSDPTVDSTLTASNILKLGSLPNIEKLIVTQLDDVLCNGDNCLVTLPIYWTLAKAIEVFSMFMSFLGIVCCLVSFGVIVRFRASPVIRSSSVLFVAITLTGIVFLFISTILLVQTPTADLCSAWGWFIDLGFAVTFTPLALKTWRINSIFGRTKLIKFVKISNKRLLFMLSVVLAAQVFLLCLWSGLAQGMTLVETSRLVQYTSASGAASTSRLNVYPQCRSNARGQPFFVLLVIMNGFVILSSGLLAFTVRRVASAFNESQQIGLLTYNVIFSVVIVIPIIIFIDAVGDTLILLMEFLFLWIAFFTLGVLIIPKVLILFNPDQDVLYSEQSSHRTVSNGFSFLSVQHMAPEILIKYHGVLKNHYQQVTEYVKNMTESGVAKLKPSSAAPVSVGVVKAPLTKSHTKVTFSNQNTYGEQGNETNPGSVYEEIQAARRPNNSSMIGKTSSNLSQGDTNYYNSSNNGNDSPGAANTPILKNATLSAPSEQASAANVLKPSSSASVSNISPPVPEPQPVAVAVAVSAPASTPPAVPPVSPVRVASQIGALFSLDYFNSK